MYIYQFSNIQSSSFYKLGVRDKAQIMRAHNFQGIKFFQNKYREVESVTEIAKSHFQD